MNMKKVLLAVILLALVLAVSYIKSVRNSESRGEAYREGKAESARQLSDYELQMDSMRQAMGEKELAFADSMMRAQVGYKSEIDSLDDLVIARNKRIWDLKSQLSKTSKPKSTSRKVSDSVSKEHERILSFYKKRYKSLPTDLTDYEKKVAINEIREETAQKYAITLAELKSLREKHKLNY
jgi:type II secretory pathway pseudopilin PulG